MSVCFLSPDSSFTKMSSGVKLTSNFQKCCIEEKRTIQSQAKLSNLIEN